jgi:two-component system cell cycle response regulator
MPGKILIVDDLATNRIILKVKLGVSCYETLQAADGESALTIARASQPDLILLDMMLPDMSGITVCERLRADPATREIPIIIITATGDRERRIQALNAGADEFLTKPLDEMVLLARIRSLLRARENEEELRLRHAACDELGFSEPSLEFAHPARIALIVDSAESGLILQRQIAPLCPSHRLEVMTVSQALAPSDTTGQQPEVYAVAADLGAQGSGLRLLSELRSRTESRHAALCVILPERARDLAAMALDLGANDLLTTPLDPQEMALRLQLQLTRKRRADALRRAVAKGLHLAVIDPLTGLYNRRYATPQLSRIASHARAQGQRFAIMLLDLDRFKLINDTYGHSAGDRVLEEVARRLRENVRPHDIVARYGGEEFLIAMPETSLNAARNAAERLCRVIEAAPIVLPNTGALVHVTASVGLAMGDGSGPDRDTPVSTILDQADRALLIAKSEGRNQVNVSRTAA